MESLETADMLMVWLLYTVIMFGLGWTLLPGWMRFMINHKLTDCNYAGERIPTAGGIVICLLLLIHSVIIKGAAYLGGNTFIPSLFAKQSLLNEFTLAAIVVVFLGFLDDAVGHKSFKGFAGHWRLWKEHRVVSTGVLKATGVSMAALLFIFHDSAVLRQPIYWIAVQCLLIVLASNSINLLDTRPGRALKGFGILVVVLAAALPSGESAKWQELMIMALPILVAAAVLLVPDLRGRIMLGDTGANLLGFAMGCWIVQVTGWKLQLLLLLVFVVLHGITWRLSLSKIIDSNRVLSWFDGLGRGSRPNKI